MPIPDYQSLMRPLLTYAADGSEKKIGDAIEALAIELKLTDDERRQLLASGNQTIFANRVYWAQVYLNKAGAIQRTRRSHFTITERGKQLLAENPTRIDAKVLTQFPEFNVFKSPKTIGEPDNGGSVTPAVDQPQEPGETPEEAILQAEAQIFENLKSQLLVRIWELSPSFFESLVVDLIVETR
jgi:restriction system protein